MKELIRYQDYFADALGRLDFPSEPAELFEPIRYTLAMGGKRMRPVLVLLGAELMGGKLEDAQHASLAIEVFHNFTLLHDDIMDEAPLRRGMATVHTKWNSNIAILSGDVMLVEAYKLISKTPTPVLPEILTVFNSAATDVCEGQQWDMNFEGQDDVNLSDYLNMIRLKTAVLLGAALQIGALCANAEKQDAENLYEFGCHLGIAFQLQDDILDVFGDPEIFGKQAGGDILSNKKTYLKLRALEKASTEQAIELKKWYSSKEFDSIEKVTSVTQLFENLNVREDAEMEMRRHYDIALKSLHNVQGSESHKAVLEHFAQELLVRVK
jgi:geranylgeranyl diphosphate synthase type II